MVFMMGGGSGDGADLSVVTATSDDVLEGKVIVDKDGNPLIGKIPAVGDQWLAVKSASWGGNLDVVPTRGYYDGSASHAVVPAADVRQAIGYTDTSKVLEDTTIAGQKGTMKNLTARSTIEFASENNTKVIAGDGAFIANNTDGVKRVCIRYNGENGYIGGNTLFGLPARSLTLTPDVNGWTDAGDASKLIDSVTVKPIPNLRGTYNGQATSLTTYQSRLYYRLPIGYYYGGSYDSSGGVAEVYMPFSSVASALGIDATKIRQGTTICGVAGTLAVQSAISFSVAVLSPTAIRVSWKNPAQGPWQGVFIQASTSGYPGTGGGSRVYTGAGNNPNQAGGNNYVDITGLSPGTTYYFTATSYCDALGWGTSNNVTATTQSDAWIYNYGQDLYGITKNRNSLASVGSDYISSRDVQTSGRFTDLHSIAACWSDTGAFDANIVSKYSGVRIYHKANKTMSGSPTIGIFISAQDGAVSDSSSYLLITGYGTKNTDLTAVDISFGLGFSARLANLISKYGNKVQIGIICGRQNNTDAINFPFTIHQVYLI